MDREDFDRWLLNIAFFIMFGNLFFFGWSIVAGAYRSFYIVFLLYFVTIFSTLVLGVLVWDSVKRIKLLDIKNRLALLIVSLSFLTNQMFYGLLQNDMYGEFGVHLYSIVLWGLFMFTGCWLYRFKEQSPPIFEGFFIYLRYILLLFAPGVIFKVFEFLGAREMKGLGLILAYQAFFVFLAVINFVWSIRRILKFLKFSLEGKSKVEAKIDLLLSSEDDKKFSIVGLSPKSDLENIEFVEYRFGNRFFPELKFITELSEDFKIKLKRKNLDSLRVYVAYKDGTYSEHLIEGV